MPTDPRLKTLHASIAETPYSAEVTSLCIRKDDGIRQHPKQIEVDMEKGVIGDRWIWRTWKHLPKGLHLPIKFGKRCLIFCAYSVST